MFKLLSTATEAVIPGLAHDAFVRDGRLTSSVLCIITGVVVKRAHHLAILSGLSLSSVNWHLRIAIVVLGLGAKLLAGLLLNGISHQNHVSTATTSPWRGASSASSSGRHVKRLPGQVVCRVFIVPTREDVLRQISVLVEHGKTIGLSGFGQLSFYFGKLKGRQN